MKLFIVTDYNRTPVRLNMADPWERMAAKIFFHFRRLKVIRNGLYQVLSTISGKVIGYAAKEE